MAIYPKVNPSPQQHLDPAGLSYIEAWTEQAVEALQGLSLSASATPQQPAAITRGTTVSLSIPLDEHTVPQGVSIATPAKHGDATVRPTSSGDAYRRREPVRRDSLKRREALLKGKEGSRRRQRWENDRLLSNPWAQPPMPSDWEVRPTHPVHHVPYYLAPLWDAREVNKAKAASSKSKKGNENKKDDPAARVPIEVRRKLKRAKAAKGLLQDLEEEVRKFVEKWNEKETEKARDGFADIDSDEEEVVFVGRNGKMHDSPTRKRYQELVLKEKLVFDGPADDRGASFGRWLVHSIGTYYGLKTWSKTTAGNPARRVAYVGIDDEVKKHGSGNSQQQSSSSSSSNLPIALPRPLWGMV